jgi:chromate transporter
MNDNGSTLWALATTFGVLSLFAVGGAAGAVPEMHRVAVEIQHWMTDRQFTDVFAISQLAPGPNVLIVTLIGYQVAGVIGAIVATTAMCGPTAIFAYFVGRTFDRSRDAEWRAVVQAALVPVSIGLMSATGLILSLGAADTKAAVLLIVAATLFALATRFNPLWVLAAGGVLGFAGVI